MVSAPWSSWSTWEEELANPDPRRLLTVIHAAAGVDRPRGSGDWGPGDGLAQEGVLEEETPPGT